jgi:hypothetical protein
MAGSIFLLDFATAASIAVVVTGPRRGHSASPNRWGFSWCKRRDRRDASTLEPLMQAKRKAAPDTKPAKPTFQKTQDLKAATTKPAATAAGQPAPAAPSKQQRCLDLLGRRDGATLAELIAVTEWQAHSVRGFLSGTAKKKLGLAVSSTQDEDGTRRYRINRIGRMR